MSGQAAFDKPVRLAELCRVETTENWKKITKQNNWGWERDEMECHMKKETDPTVKKNWQRHMGA